MTIKGVIKDTFAMVQFHKKYITYVTKSVHSVHIKNVLKVRVKSTKAMFSY